MPAFNGIAGHCFIKLDMDLDIVDVWSKRVPDQGRGNLAGRIRSKEAGGQECKQQGVAILRDQTGVTR